MKAFLLLAVGVLLTLDTAAQRRPRPQVGRYPVGPAYLPRLARRPSQRHLDSLANLARHRALLTAK